MDESAETKSQASCGCENATATCQFEVLYDEALCQVESFQRQVRHLRTESKRLKTANEQLTHQVASLSPACQLLKQKDDEIEELKRRLLFLEKQKDATAEVDLPPDLSANHLLPSISSCGSKDASKDNNFVNLTLPTECIDKIEVPGLITQGIGASDTHNDNLIHSVSDTVTQHHRATACNAQMTTSSISEILDNDEFLDETRVDSVLVSAITNEENKVLEPQEKVSICEDIPKPRIISIDETEADFEPVYDLSDSGGASDGNRNDYGSKQLSPAGIGLCDKTQVVMEEEVKLPESASTVGNTQIIVEYSSEGMDLVIDEEKDAKCNVTVEEGEILDQEEKIDNRKEHESIQEEHLVQQYLVTKEKNISRANSSSKKSLSEDKDQRGKSKSNPYHKRSRGSGEKIDHVIEKLKHNQKSKLKSESKLHLDRHHCKDRRLSRDSRESSPRHSVKSRGRHSRDSKEREGGKNSHRSRTRSDCSTESVHRSGSYHSKVDTKDSSSTRSTKRGKDASSSASVHPDDSEPWEKPKDHKFDRCNRGKVESPLTERHFDINMYHTQDKNKDCHSQVFEKGEQNQQNVSETIQNEVSLLSNKRKHSYEDKSAETKKQKTDVDKSGISMTINLPKSIGDFESKTDLKTRKAPIDDRHEQQVIAKDLCVSLEHTWNNDLRKKLQQQRLLSKKPNEKELTPVSSNDLQRSKVYPVVNLDKKFAGLSDQDRLAGYLNIAAQRDRDKRLGFKGEIIKPRNKNKKEENTDDSDFPCTTSDVGETSVEMLSTQTEGFCSEDHMSCVEAPHSDLDSSSLSLKIDISEDDEEKSSSTADQPQETKQQQPTSSPAVWKSRDTVGQNKETPQRRNSGFKIPKIHSQNACPTSDKVNTNHMEYNTTSVVDHCVINDSDDQCRPKAGSDPRLKHVADKLLTKSSSVPGSASGAGRIPLHHRPHSPGLPNDSRTPPIVEYDPHNPGFSAGFNFPSPPHRMRGPPPRHPFNRPPRMPPFFPPHHYRHPPPNFNVPPPCLPPRFPIIPLSQPGHGYSIEGTFNASSFAMLMGLAAEIQKQQGQSPNPQAILQQLAATPGGSQLTQMLQTASMPPSNKATSEDNQPKLDALTQLLQTLKNVPHSPQTVVSDGGMNPSATQSQQQLQHSLMQSLLPQNKGTTSVLDSDKKNEVTMPSCDPRKTGKALGKVKEQQCDADDKLKYKINISDDLLESVKQALDNVAPAMDDKSSPAPRKVMATVVSMPASKQKMSQEFTKKVEEDLTLLGAQLPSASELFQPQPKENRKKLSSSKAPRNWHEEKQGYQGGKRKRGAKHMKKVKKVLLHSDEISQTEFSADVDLEEDAFHIDESAVDIVDSQLGELLSIDGISNSEGPNANSEQAEISEVQVKQTQSTVEIQGLNTSVEIQGLNNKNSVTIQEAHSALEKDSNRCKDVLSVEPIPFTKDEFKKPLEIKKTDTDPLTSPAYSETDALFNMALGSTTEPADIVVVPEESGDSLYLEMSPSTSPSNLVTSFRGQIETIPSHDDHCGIISAKTISQMDDKCTHTPLSKVFDGDAENANGQLCDTSPTQTAQAGTTSARCVSMYDIIGEISADTETTKSLFVSVAHPQSTPETQVVSPRESKVGAFAEVALTTSIQERHSVSDNCSPNDAEISLDMNEDGTKVLDEICNPTSNVPSGLVRPVDLDPGTYVQDALCNDDLLSEGDAESDKSPPLSPKSSTMSSIVNEDAVMSVEDLHLDMGISVLPINLEVTNDVFGEDTGSSYSSTGSDVDICGLDSDDIKTTQTETIVANKNEDTMEEGEVYEEEELEDDVGEVLEPTRPSPRRSRTPRTPKKSQGLVKKLITSAVRKSPRFKSRGKSSHHKRDMPVVRDAPSSSGGGRRRLDKSPDRGSPSRSMGRDKRSERDEDVNRRQGAACTDRRDSPSWRSGRHRDSRTDKRSQERERGRDRSRHSHSGGALSKNRSSR